MLITYLALMPVAGVLSYGCEISAPSPITCGINEEYVPCRMKSPPQFCNISYVDFLCPEDNPCGPGCDCIKDHLRNYKGCMYVFNEECPPPPQIPSCGDNEVGSTCRKTCPPDTCNFDPTKQACKPGPCQPGCNCIENYLRDATGKCVPKDQCPKSNTCVPPQTCEIPYKCRRTCAEPNPPNCPSYSNVSKNVKGCKCKTGFILSEKYGECVRIEDCPRGNPCGRNATFQTCNNRCPYNYCPVDDSPPDFSCVPPSPCHSGCVCNLNYRKKSINEDECILASECTPVNCTRPNEIWSPCPSDCLREDCENAGKEVPVCNTLVLNCQPKCICKPNTFRDENKVCVPVEQCPKKNPQT